MMADFDHKSMADQLFETKFQSKVASELWLSIGGKDYRLVGKQIRLGRALDNDIVLEDNSCSRYHAMVSIEGHDVFIHDLKSRNGVKINGKPVSRASLADNTKVEIGDLAGLFFFRRRAPSAGTARTALAQDIEATGAGRQELQESQSERNSPSLIDRFKNMPPKMRLAVVGGSPLLLLLVFMMLSSALSFFGGSGEIPKPVAQYEDESCAKANRVIEEVSTEKFEACLELEDLGNFRKSKACLRELARNDRVCTALERVIKNQKALAKHRYEAGKKALDYHYYNHAIVNFNEVLLIADEGSSLRIQALKALEDAEQNLRKPR